MINTALQNNALDKKTGEAVRNYIADYKNMKDKAIVMQMEMQGGKIGRSSQVALNAIINQIPNGSTPDSKTAQQQVDNLQEQQDILMAKYPGKYQDYKKVEAYKAKAQEANSLGVGHVVSQGGQNFVIDEVDKNGKATKWHKQ